MPMQTYPPAMSRLVNELMKLPSVGEKSASRLAYFLLTTDENTALGLSKAIREAREKTRFCNNCFALTEDEYCSICLDPTRDKSLICVVEKPLDVIIVEQNSSYSGLYHVLHKLWSPIKGISPEDTKVNELFKRIEKSQDSGNKIKEILIATSTTVEGDATAHYIANHLSGTGVEVTRIAQGIPKGGEIEYADSGTLSHAIEGRRRI